MLMEERICSFGLDPNATRNGETLKDKAATLFRKIKLSRSLKNLSIAEMLAVDMACRLLGVPFDRKDPEFTSSHYKKVLNLLKVELKISWETVIWEKLDMQFSSHFSAKVRYALSQYIDTFDTTGIDVYNDALNICAATIALLEVQKEFKLNKPDLLNQFGLNNNQQLNTLVNSYSGVVKGIDPDEWQAISAPNKKPTTSSSTSDNTTSSSSSVDNQDYTSQYLSTYSTNISKEPAAATTTANNANITKNIPVKSNRQLMGAGIDLNKEIQVKALSDAYVEEIKVKKRKAYEVWRDSILCDYDRSENDNEAIDSCGINDDINR